MKSAPRQTTVTRELHVHVEGVASPVTEGDGGERVGKVQSDGHVERRQDMIEHGQADGAGEQGAHRMGSPAAVVASREDRGGE